MQKKEILNSKRAALLGFYAYMLFSAVNYISYLMVEKNLLSSAVIFWSGLVVFFGYSAILNLKDKRSSSYES